MTNALNSIHHTRRLPLDLCRNMRMARFCFCNAAVAVAVESSAQYRREKETHVEDPWKEPWKAVVDVLMAGAGLENDRKKKKNKEEDLNG